MIGAAIIGMPFAALLVMQLVGAYDRRSMAIEDMASAIRSAARTAEHAHCQVLLDQISNDVQVVEDTLRIAGTGTG